MFAYPVTIVQLVVPIGTGNDLGAVVPSPNDPAVLFPQANSKPSLRIPDNPAKIIPIVVQESDTERMNTGLDLPAITPLPITPSPPVVVPHVNSCLFASSAATALPVLIVVQLEVPVVRVGLKN